MSNKFDFRALLGRTTTSRMSNFASKTFQKDQTHALPNFSRNNKF